MSDWNLGAQFSGCGYREESVSLFEKIRKHGIAATACACRGLRKDPFEKGNLIPLESALALERGESAPPYPDIFQSRLYFYRYPKPVLQHSFSPTKHFLGRTQADKFLLRFSLTPRRTDQRLAQRLSNKLPNVGPTRKYSRPLRTANRATGGKQPGIAPAE